MDDKYSWLVFPICHISVTGRNLGPCKFLYVTDMLQTSEEPQIANISVVADISTDMSELFFSYLSHICHSWKFGAKFLYATDTLQIGPADISQICCIPVQHICSVSVRLVREVMTGGIKY